MSTRIGRTILRNVCVLFLLGHAAATAQAQSNPFRTGDLDLSQEDVRLLEAAAQKLYAVEGAKVGAVESWSNPATGNAGTVKLLSIYTWQNMPCRQISHRITAAARKDPLTVQVDRCRTAAGEWKARF